MITKWPLLGVGISVTDMAGAIAEIDRWIAGGESNFVCVRDAHGIVLAQDDRAFRELHQKAGLVIADGMPVAVLPRLLGATGIARIRGSDLMRTLCAHSVTNGYRHFLLGGAPGIAVRLAAVLNQDYPGIQIAGIFCPPFRPLTAEENASVIRQINESGADIVWLGISTPKQEFWMAEHMGRIKAPVMLGVGAAFDYLAGIRPEAPGWMRRLALEWLHRILSEPRRLGLRYARVVPRFILLAGAEMLTRAWARSFSRRGVYRDVPPR